MFYQNIRGSYDVRSSVNSDNGLRFCARGPFLFMNHSLQNYRRPRGERPTKCLGISTKSFYSRLDCGEVAPVLVLALEYHFFKFHETTDSYKYMTEAR